jgi:hypothetical protein
MLKLHIVQAAKGDCLILEYGPAGEPHYMLVDGGPSGIYPSHLRAELARIAGAGGRLDRVVLSHIDDDHAHGLLDFLNDLVAEKNKGEDLLIQVGELWHNTFSQIAGPTNVNALRTLLARQQLLDAPEPDVSTAADAAPPAGGRGVLSSTAGERAAREIGPQRPSTEEIALPDGTMAQEITLGSEPLPGSGPLPGDTDQPGNAAPADLVAGEQVLFELQRALLLDPADRSFTQGDNLTRQAARLGMLINPQFSAAPGGKICADNLPAPVETDGLTLTFAGPSQANLDQLKQRWEAWLATRAVGAFDTSYTNLSSIMFLAESGGKSILFTGDGRGDALLAALRQNGRLAGGTLHVDVLKMPHHGSSRNVPPELFTTITADRYVISADGENGNPDEDTLQAIAAAAKAAGRPFEIWITNETDTTRWFRAHYDPAEYQYRWVLLPEGHDAFVLDLDLPDPAAAIG